VQGQDAGRGAAWAIVLRINVLSGGGWVACVCLAVCEGGVSSGPVYGSVPHRQFTKNCCMIRVEILILLPCNGYTYTLVFTLATWLGISSSSSILIAKYAHASWPVISQIVCRLTTITALRLITTALRYNYATTRGNAVKPLACRIK